MAVIVACLVDISLFVDIFPVAIRKEIQEIEDGHYSQSNNVLKVWLTDSFHLYV